MKKKKKKFQISIKENKKKGFKVYFKNKTAKKAILTNVTVF